MLIINENIYNNYNNSFNNGSTNYYHRGASPFDDEAILVGNIDSSVYDSSNDQKAYILLFIYPNIFI